MRDDFVCNIVTKLCNIFRKRFTVYLAGSHPVTHGAWSYGPNVIEVGGLNVKEAKPLPKDLQLWMESAKNGAILVSFGSFFKPSQMDNKKLEIMANTFRSLNQYSFIWKWDAEVDNLPSNVKKLSWIPQQVGHENLHNRPKLKF